MKKKFQMPSAKFILKNRINKNKKGEPVWIFLEREMRANSDKKPYNNVVGEWLVFLKDLKSHYRRVQLQELNRLTKNCGPPWFIELSSFQRETLDSLKFDIHTDLIGGQTVHVETALKHIGITKKINKKTLMTCMETCVEDPGVFVWNLYKDIYKVPPSTLLPSYDLNSRLLMSSLVFIDYKECLQSLDKIMEKEPPPPPPKPAKPPKNFKPQVQFGEYLQRTYAPFYTNKPQEKDRVPRPLKRKLGIRSAESLEAILLDTKFLERRMERNIKEQCKERICKYKFWEPPPSLRYTDPKMRAYALALKMFTKKAKPRFRKYKPPYENIQCNIGGVSYFGGKPNYVINSVCVRPTGYIPINGGLVKYNDEHVLNIMGHWKFPNKEIKKCDVTCNCLANWDSSAMKYIEASKCKCHHLYDFKQEGKLLETYFYKPTKHSPFWIDEAKIYQMDPMEDFVKQCVLDALSSKTMLVKPALNEALKISELVAALLADLADTPLIIPHLPQANLLKNLQTYVSKKIRPPLTGEQHKRNLTKAKRQWNEIQHQNFRQLATYISFKPEELQNFTWNHRHVVQKLFDTLLKRYVRRNVTKQIEQSQLLWATMQNDRYGGKSFRDCFTSYFPTRLKDLFLLDPFDYEHINRYIRAKTCPIRL